MTVYIEDTLIENFIITFLVLNISFCFLNEKKSLLRVIFASLFGGVISVIYSLLNLNNILLFVTKMCIGYIICLIGYKTKIQKKQILFFLIFIVITAIYGGINLMIYYSFNMQISLPVLLLSIFVITYILKQLQMKFYQKRTINNFLYDIVIKFNNICIKSKGYLDSGNILFDPQSQKPIVLVNFKLFEKINKDFSIQNLLTKNLNGLKNGHYIEVKTATSIDKILVFSVDSLEIFQNDKKIIVNEPFFALSKVKITGLDCDVILNPKLLGG